MSAKAFEAIEKFKMLYEIESIVVGVSGGADSIALLHFLLKVCSNKGIRLIAAHVNHELRGEESERDENFVCSICHNWGVDLSIKRVNIKSLAIDRREGLEECGRNFRYKYFNELAQKNSARIATAHTLSDNIETLFFNITRGSALKGLCGIPPVRDKIIRPFIYMSRSDIESYCLNNSLRFIVDSTNFDRIYTRNKIRMDIMPALRSINPKFENTINNMVKNLMEDENYLEEIAVQEFNKSHTDEGFDPIKIKELSPSIKNRVIIKILKIITNKSVSRKHVDLVNRVINKELKCISIDKKVIYISENGILSVRNLKYDKNNKSKLEYSLNELNILTETKKTFIINIVTYEEYCKSFIRDSRVVCNCFDIGIIADNEREKLVFRNRNPGDKFSILNRKVTKTIKKLFNELKIPVESRGDLTLLAKQSEVIWIDGIGISEEYKVTDRTKLIAVISEG